VKLQLFIYVIYMAYDNVNQYWTENKIFLFIFYFCLGPARGCEPRDGSGEGDRSGGHLQDARRRHRQGRLRAQGSFIPSFIPSGVYIVRPTRMRSSIPLFEPGSPRFFWWYENSE
jgi:hypothetical protein